ncbi:hypothetical protein ADK34_09220 [Streptomyces viridochromogenes]|uniref:Uncharacterized protein n=1 Tax=Streptomyces viridochromogenes TaxID=1938 RepID=A0A0L8L3B1_STRVR|nr:hypothetical protein ADK34_09220 [Streptomyces viridochromogenes]
MRPTPTERDRLLLFGAADLSVAFVAQAAVDLGSDAMPTRRRVAVRGTRGTRGIRGIRGTRGIGPADLLLDSRVGDVQVDGHTGLVPLDGSPIRSGAAESVSPNRLHFL